VDELLHVACLNNWLADLRCNQLFYLKYIYKNYKSHISNSGLSSTPSILNNFILPPLNYVRITKIIKTNI